MLSILIPIYNWDVTKLVNEIIVQCEKLDIVFEIHLLDDCSTNYKVENAKLGQKLYVSYIEAHHNKGRSKSRNRLYEYARYNHVLFLDCDVAIESDDFIKKYVESIPCKGIIFGGITYSDAQPSREYMLRWKYGREIESKSGQKNSHLHLQSANILLNKTIIKQKPFDESITNYGYEDTLLAQRCKNDGVDIKYLHNPIVHLGLDTNKDFLVKTKSALSNLIDLRDNHQIESTRLVDAFEWLRFHGLQDRFTKLMKKRIGRIEKNLDSTSPSMMKFQIWKLFYYVVAKQNKQAEDL